MSRGRVYRTCACRDPDGRQLGATCPQLAADGKHGAWAFAVDLPSLDGRRKTMRRRGSPTRTAARRALADVTARQGAGVKLDDRETVASNLRAWLTDKRHALKPKTLHQYGEYIEKDLIPALGAIRLEALRHEHVASMIRDLQAAGRGPTTIRRIVATLRSALADAVEQHRLARNVAAHAPLPKVQPAERQPWTAAQAVAFLDHVTGDRYAELFEVLIGCGLRRGEALAVRWVDVDLGGRALQVRHTLSDVAGKLTFTTPKTKGSAAGVGLSARVCAALQRQSARQAVERAEWGDAYQDDGLVFARENGAPLRPEHVLRRFHALSDEAELPRVRLHDLRHLAATTMLAAGVPLALVSKVLRHSQVGITADIYGHLTRETTHAAADVLGATLDAAAAELAGERAARVAAAAAREVIRPNTQP